MGSVDEKRDGRILSHLHDPSECTLPPTWHYCSNSIIQKELVHTTCSNTLGIQLQGRPPDRKDNQQDGGGGPLTRNKQYD